MPGLGYSAQILLPSESRQSLRLEILVMPVYLRNRFAFLKK